jgi:hypothetical protein
VQELAKRAGVKALPFSAHTGEGREQLWSALLRMAAIDLQPAPLEPPAKA